MPIKTYRSSSSFPVDSAADVAALVGLLGRAATDLVRDGVDAKEFEDCGVWTPSSGPAQYRFTPLRRVVKLQPVSGPAELLTADHPVGLPLDRSVRRPEATSTVWHYLSLRLAEIPGMPHCKPTRCTWPARTDQWAGR